MQHKLAYPHLPYWDSLGTLRVGPARFEHAPAELADLALALHQPKSRDELIAAVPTLGIRWHGRMLSAFASLGMLARGSAAGEVAVFGSSPAAFAIRRGLHSAGQPSKSFGAGAEREALPGRRVGEALRCRPRLVVLASDTAEPCRTITDALAKARVPYLPVRLEPGKASVGPLASPESSCLRCFDLWRAAADPEWPLELAQLAHARVESPGWLTSWAVSTACAQVLAHISGQIPDTGFRTLSMSVAEFAITEREVPQHPQCPFHF
ncbi:MAG: TOMM precursor leader peptide-binding protein [Propionibacteriaceae bacterium]|nr:TOMM precursor leader peptide-binding protein [Propionibacteriaceae bacterium]